MSETAVEDGVCISVLNVPGAEDVEHGDTLRFGVTADGGWSWSAEIDDPDYDIAHARFGEYTASSTDSYGNALTLPSLCAGPRSETDEESVENAGLKTVSGTDRTTVLMGVPNQSLASFKATTSDALITALASHAGVTIGALPESWPIGEEEVKGETLTKAVGRLRDAAALVSAIGTDGQLTFRDWSAEGDPLDFPWETLKREYDDTQIYSGRRYVKQSSKPEAGNQIFTFPSAGAYDQPLSTPLHDVSAIEIESIGALAAWGTFDASNGLIHWWTYPGSPYVAPGPATGSQPATLIKILVDPIGVENDILVYPVPAKVQVSGTPEPEEGLPEGFDLSFTFPPPAGTPDSSLGSWPYRDNASDTLFAGRQWLKDRYAKLLTKLSKDGDRLILTGPCHYGVELFQELTYKGIVYMVWSIQWDPGGDQTTVTMVRKTLYTFTFPEDEDE